jgi:capsular polysaccharide biosynthesis protein
MSPKNITLALLIACFLFLGVAVFMAYLDSTPAKFPDVITTMPDLSK